MLIAQITDLHVRPAGRTANGFVEVNAMLESAVAALLAETRLPDVVLATGDLTDNGLVEEYQELRRILARLPTPVHLIPGNHDRRDNLRAVFPDHGYLPGEGFLNYVVEGWPVRLIGLDTVVDGQTHGEICPARLAWLERALSDGGDRPTFIFMHHPPFQTGIYAMDRINCLGGDAMADLIRRHPNVERVACGHHHRSIQARWAGTIGSIAPSTAHQVMLDFGDAPDSRIRMEPPGYHLHLWRPGAGLVTHTSLIGQYAGPFDFVSDPAYPAFASDKASPAR
jgi:3',5'-cyclic AMP phosphodiesterase CpdA